MRPESQPPDGSFARGDSVQATCVVVRADRRAASLEEAIPIFDEFQRRRRITVGPQHDSDRIAEMKATIKAVRSEAVADGQFPPKFNRLLPLIETMATETGDSAIWEGYQVLYRMVSPWTHFGGRSMSGHRVEPRPDGLHIVPTHAYGADAIRSLAAPTMLILLGSTSRICELGIDGETRILQNTIVLWPAETQEDAGGISGI